jgi:hypothetical protein
MLSVAKDYERAAELTKKRLKKAISEEEVAPGVTSSGRRLHYRPIPAG